MLPVKVAKGANLAGKANHEKTFLEELWKKQSLRGKNSWKRGTMKDNTFRGK